MEKIFSQHIISPNQLLRDALIQMTSQRKGILFVVDNSFQLLGALSDGDVRRALLNNVSLNTPVDKIMNLNPKKAFNTTEARKLLSENLGYLEIPLLSQGGVIQSIVTINEVIDNTEVKSLEALNSINDKKEVKVLAIIPARGGSRRIPKKNIAKIGDDSLLGLAIKVAKATRSIDAVIVSTDDEEIAAEARKYGVDVPWLRPEEYATDVAKSVDVVIHAFEKFNKLNGYLPEFGVLLEPTAPLRNAELVEKAITVLKNNLNADSLISVNKLRHNFHPEELLTVREDGYLKPYLPDRTLDNRKLRGEQTDLFVQNGLIYVFRVKILFEKKSIYGSNAIKFETSDDLFLDIDNYEDLKLAQLLIN